MVAHDTSRFPSCFWQGAGMWLETCCKFCAAFGLQQGFAPNMGWFEQAGTLATAWANEDVVAPAGQKMSLCSFRSSKLTRRAVAAIIADIMYIWIYIYIYTSIALTFRLSLFGATYEPRPTGLLCILCVCLVRRLEGQQACGGPCYKAFGFATKLGPGHASSFPVLVAHASERKGHLQQLSSLNARMLCVDCACVLLMVVPRHKAKGACQVCHETHVPVFSHCQDSWRRMLCCGCGTCGAISIYRDIHVVWHMSHVAHVVAQV